MRIAAFLSCLIAGTAGAESPAVVTDIPAVHSLTALVMEGRGVPALMLEPGADPHDYQLRPSQARALAGADLLVWIGPDLTPWLEDARAAGFSGASLALLAHPETRLRSFEDAHHADEEDHGHGPTDPHAWLDPDNAAIWLGLVAAELARIDPDGAPVYRANAVAAQTALAAAADRIEQRLAPAAGVPLIVYHDAYGYFADRFGLSVTPLAGGDAAAPGAQALSDMRDHVRSLGRPCIFPEVDHDDAVSALLAEGTDARIGAPLDPEARRLVPGPGLYAESLEALADAIAGCVDMR